MLIMENVDEGGKIVIKPLPEIRYMESPNEVFSQHIQGDNQRSVIYVTSEISKDFFEETKSGGTFIPPDILIPSADNQSLQTYSSVNIKTDFIKHCPCCGQTVCSVVDLQQHLDICIGKENYKFTLDVNKSSKKKYECVDCGKQFVSKNFYTKHRYFCDSAAQLGKFFFFFISS